MASLPGWGIVISFRAAQFRSLFLSQSCCQSPGESDVGDAFPLIHIPISLNSHVLLPQGPLALEDLHFLPASSFTVPFLPAIFFLGQSFLALEKLLLL